MLVRFLFVCAGLIGALAPPAIAGKSTDTVRFANDQVLPDIDPYFNNERMGVVVAHHVWDTLVYRDPDTGEYKGQLSTGWKQVDDRTFDFDLRQGVKFHNGEEFDAEDVVFTLNFVSKPENKVTTQQNVSWIDRAEKLDKYKVRIITKKVFPAIFEYLAGPVVIHPNEYYEKVGSKGQNQTPVGSGPYKITRYIPGKSILMERNPDYFKESPKPQPKIGKIEIRFIPDMQTQVAELISDGIDFVFTMAPDQAGQLKAMPNLQVVPSETMRIAFLMMNQTDQTPAPMLKDPRVRKAIIHAINREAMAKEIVGEGAQVINVMCFRTQFGCTDEGAARYPYDPAKAKALLTEAGFPNGFDIEIGSFTQRPHIEAIIGYLRAVGIRANLSYLQYPALRDMNRKFKSSIVYQNWGSFSINDTSASTPVFFGMTEDDMARDKEVADLLNQASNMSDQAARKGVYKQALQLIADRALGVPLFSITRNYVATKDLVFKTYPDELPRFWEMSWK